MIKWTKNEVVIKKKCLVGGAISFKFHKKTAARIINHLLT